MNNTNQTALSSQPTLIKHHPDANMLVEYASGSLPWGLSIAVAAHLQFCKKCQQQHADLCALGGSYLLEVPQEPLQPDAFDRLLHTISSSNDLDSSSNLNSSANSNRPIDPNRLAQKKQPTKVQATNLNQAMLNAKKAGINAEHLPKVVKKLLPPRLRWQKLSNALRSARLLTGQNTYEVAFHKISKGGKVIEHDHRGLEVTLVLEGSFSDEEGIYSPGDFIVKAPGQAHRPTASQNQDCLCLSVCEAPVKVTGLLGKLINPFLGIKPI